MHLPHQLALQIKTNHILTLTLNLQNTSRCCSLKFTSNQTIYIVYILHILTNFEPCFNFNKIFEKHDQI